MNFSADFIEIEKREALIASFFYLLIIRNNVFERNALQTFSQIVPDLLTSMIPLFFRELRIFRIVTGFMPEERDRSSLVTFAFSPYS